MKPIIFTLLFFFILTTTSLASDSTLEKYVSTFDYDSRLEMKVNSKKLIDLLEDGEAVLVDIRFTEDVVCREFFFQQPSDRLLVVNG